MESGNRPTLGALLRRWRERALLTQEQLAAETGLNVRTIRRLEGDALQRPRSDSLRRLAAALELDEREWAALAVLARSFAGSVPSENGSAGGHRAEARVGRAGQGGPQLWVLVEEVCRRRPWTWPPGCRRTAP
ncbi:hypothetical protein GCM10022419_061320 [Nonomuraea rosea]|uniref:HTH cro/C1-type domain-containing protein n=1 Tax=Nonomuraea rosea TaxID=638574 RepID=A0ABP6XUU2_9ACTN